MATASRASREIIRFEPGRPETVALKFSEGKEIAGQYGVQYMYTTTDDRIFFLDPDVARSLDELGVGRGEEVRIGKTRRPKGGYDWEIERVRRPQAVPPRDETPRNEPPAPAPLPVMPADPVTPASARMMACFKAAIDAVAEAQAYANRKSLGITFTSENITSAALSCYINECKGGR